MRYHALLIGLHWLMALSFLLMLTSGLVMENMSLDKPTQFKLFQWHKSLGVLLLVAVCLRILVRVFTAIPSLPAAMKRLEQLGAKAGHLALYALMVLVPLAGWVMVSSSVYGLPTIVFGWFEWPHIPGIAANKDLSEFAEEAHGLLAYAFMAVIAVHIAAVIKHAVIDRENLLPRMGIGKTQTEKE